MTEATCDEASRGHILIMALGITVLALLMLVSITGAAQFADIPNHESYTVSIVDTAKNKFTATIPVGVEPIGGSVSPDGKEAYVAKWLSNTTFIINTHNNIATPTVPVGIYSYGVTVSSDRKEAYVAKWLSNTTSVINTHNNIATPTVPVRICSYGVAVSSDKKRGICGKMVKQRYLCN